MGYSIQMIKVVETKLSNGLSNLRITMPFSTSEDKKKAKKIIDSLEKIATDYNIPIIYQ